MRKVCRNIPIKKKMIDLYCLSGAGLQVYFFLFGDISRGLNYKIVLNNLSEPFNYES